MFFKPIVHIIDNINIGKKIDNSKGIFPPVPRELEKNIK